MRDRLAHVHAFLAERAPLLIERSLAREKWAICQGNRVRRANMLRAAAKGTHSTVEWMAVRSYYGDKCLACHRRGKITKDHVLRVSMGGSDRADNLQPLCKSCNCSKHDVDYRWDHGEWAGVVALATVVGE